MIATISLVSCKESGIEAKQISSSEKNAESIYLTDDRNGSWAVAWIEKTENSLTRNPRTRKNPVSAERFELQYPIKKCQF